VTEHAAADVASLPAVQYLTFRLGAAEYAIEILKVQEIKRSPPSRRCLTCRPP
jgi:chemotaxis signal transduction protein